MRFSGKLPSATLLPVASFLSSMGTTTSLVMPLSVSLPAISYRSPPKFLIEVEAKCATGNLAVLNHRGLLISVSDSSLARSMLLRSMSNSALDIDAQLLRHEADLALVDQQALCVGMAGGE